MSTFVLIVIIINSCNTQSNCVFSDIHLSGNRLDLRALAHTKITGGDSQYIYHLTPCRNAAACSSDGSTHTGMCIQTEPTNEELCAVVANWDSGNIQPSFNQATETWMFQYKNGNDCNNQNGQFPRELTIYYICNETIGDYYVLAAAEINRCIYEYKILTKWACPNEIYTTPVPDDVTFSFGTMSLLLLFSLLFIYFVVGWIISSFVNRNDKGYDCIDNCPHSTFWGKFPLLVYHGCGYTKDYLFELFCPRYTTQKEGLLELEM